MKTLVAGWFLIGCAFGQSGTTAIDPAPWPKTGWVRPFGRMPKYLLRDQKAIWTSPAHTAKRDIKWWAIFGGATAALVATDRWTMMDLPNSKTQVSVGTWGSRFGAAYSLIPISAAFYAAGTRRHDQRLRETGLIAFETLADASIVYEVVKLAADRARPLESDGGGHFRDGRNGPWSSSFPSGHSINSWALASVIAHEYRKPWVYVAAYGLASTIAISRVGARQHFPGDVVAGAAMGWFLGDYVYGRRHNRELDRKTPVVRRVLQRVRIGAALP
jgi:membrane-associated phospholipid phosphatase